MEKNFNLENNLALCLAKTAHGSQLYGTHPYVEYHVLGVVNNIINLGFNSKYITVALLHDVVEDTHITLETLSQLFSKEIVEAVSLLTYTKSVTRDEYLKKIKNNKLAKIVKIADATFNMNENLRNHNFKRASVYSNYISCLIN